MIDTKMKDYEIEALQDALSHMKQWATTKNKETVALKDDLDRAHIALITIRQWVDAYPLSVFPEPDLKKVAKVLADRGISLDAVSVSTIRHTLEGLKGLIDDAL